MATTKKDAPVEVNISAPKMKVLPIRIRGSAPYVSNNFSGEAKTQMEIAQSAGSTQKKGRKREPKDFEAGYRGSLHQAAAGWYGIPAPAFRNAMIDACRMVGFKMTHAKMSVFVREDGFDTDGQPLVRITAGEPRKVTHYVRNATGVADIRARGMFDAGWEATVRIRYDSDQFTEQDVVNLMLRVGIQVGVGAGRPFSKESAGQGWGTFELADAAYSEAAD